jgi:DNA helicase-2/ATP-dependent DNA helicase PcrA
VSGNVIGGRAGGGRGAGGRGEVWRPGRQAGAKAAAAAQPGGAPASADAADIGERAVTQYFKDGERVLHAVLGEGTVLAVEARGIILVRFDNDGSERRLMANVAPLRKLRA